MLFALVVLSLSLLLVLVLVFLTLKAWLRFFGPKPVTSSHLQPSASRVRVLSWNANQNPDWNCNADFKHERIADFLPQMNHYDVIAFQDMCLTGNVNVTPLLEHARRLGFEFISSPPLPWFTLPVFDGGLLVLSRFPIVETEFVRFDDAAYADRFRDKGIRYCRLKLSDDLELHLFNTHLQSDYDVVVPSDASMALPAVADWESALAKASQLRQLQAFVARKCSDGAPCMVLGDFNAAPAGQTTRLMSPLAMMRSRQRGGCSDAVGIDSICGPVSSNVAMKSFDYEHSDDEGDAPPTESAEQHIRINVPMEVADDDSDFRDPDQSPTIADICRALQTDSHTFRDILAERIESKDKHRKDAESKPWAPQKPMSSILLSTGRLTDGHSMLTEENTVLESFTSTDRPYAALSDHAGVVCDLRVVRSTPL